jgi:hypothetical protein
MRQKPRCGHPMRRSTLGTACGRPEGHPGRHMSAESLQRKQAARGQGIRTHGYAGYGNGCRCRTCTDAKAAHMRQRRADAYVTDTAPETDPAVTHGTRFAYEERGCRCGACVTAERGSSRWSRPKRSEAA